MFFLGRALDDLMRHRAEQHIRQLRETTTNLILEAVSANDEGELRRLLNTDGDGEIANNHVASLILVDPELGLSPLHIVTAQGREDALRIMMQSIPVEQRFGVFQKISREGFTLLHTAAFPQLSIAAVLQGLPVPEFPGIGIFEALLEGLSLQQRIQIIDSYSLRGDTLLHNIAVDSTDTMFNHIVDKYYSKPERLSRALARPDREGNTVLHRVALGNIENRLLRLLERIPQQQRLTMLTKKNKAGLTPIQMVFRDTRTWNSQAVIGCSLEQSIEKLSQLINVEISNLFKGKLSLEKLGALCAHLSGNLVDSYENHLQPLQLLQRYAFSKKLDIYKRYTRNHQQDATDLVRRIESIPSDCIQDEIMEELQRVMSNRKTNPGGDYVSTLLACLTIINNSPQPELQALSSSQPPSHT